MADGTAGAVGGGRGVAAAGAERESARDTTRAATANHHSDRTTGLFLFDFSHVIIS